MAVADDIAAMCRTLDALAKHGSIEGYTHDDEGQFIVTYKCADCDETHIKTIDAVQIAREVEALAFLIKSGYTVMG